MSHSQTWFLLQQEGFLAQACLCNGLTALAHADICDNRGLYYSAFFELSIGLERMMKLIIVLDHMACNSLAPPRSQAIQGYQHKLVALFKAVNEICAARGLSPPPSLRDNTLSRRLLTFLDKFSHPDGRYANLNKLTGRQRVAQADPLTEWGKIATEVFRKQGTKSQRMAAERSRHYARALDGVAKNLIADLDGQPQNVEELFVRSSELRAADKHAIFALVILVEWLRGVLDEATRDATRVNHSLSSGIAMIPDMQEFFQFAWANKSVVMRKKRWP